MLAIKSRLGRHSFDHVIEDIQEGLREFLQSRVQSDQIPAFDQSDDELWSTLELEMGILVAVDASQLWCHTAFGQWTRNL